MTGAGMGIRGIGLVGGFGLGVGDARAAWQAGGRSNDRVTVTGPAGPRDLALYRADVTPLRRYLRGGVLRRMNRFARLAVLGACEALADADLDLRGRHDVGIILASGYGASQSTFDFLDTMIEEEGRCPSPTLFANSVHASAASHLGIALGCGGPCLTVSQFEMSPLSALLSAGDWLATGRVTAVLFGAVDEFCDVLAYSYERFFGAPGGEELRPLAWRRQTAVMGEGAAFLVLTREAVHGRITAAAWRCAEDVTPDPSGGLVLGADGHLCTARTYRRWAVAHPHPRVYSPVYGSLPGGQAFDLALTAALAEDERVQLLKCNEGGDCGEIRWERS